MTWREIVYIINDELKLDSDDSLYNENHIIFLLNKYRPFILKLKYSDIKKVIPDSNYQTIQLNLEETNDIPMPCKMSLHLRSTEKVPSYMTIGNNRVYFDNYFKGEITLVSKDRMRYVGHNKYMKNMIYCAIEPDDFLYLKFMNTLYLSLTKIKVHAIFEDAILASKLEYNEGDSCDLMDKEFPMEDSLVPALIEVVVKELLGALYRPEDAENNASDDLANLAAFIQRNTKLALSK